MNNTYLILGSSFHNFCCHWGIFINILPGINLEGDWVMSLQDKLDDRRKKFESSAAPEKLTIMHRATNDLLHSGIMERVLKTGDRAPDFSLPDERGDLVGSLELLRKGPLVVSFYRGAW
jgi:hypothetical protein